MIKRLRQLETKAGRVEVWRKVKIEACDRALALRKTVLDPITRQLPVRTLEQYFAVRSRVVPWVSDANPFHPIYAAPHDVVYNHGAWPIRVGLVKGGDWDTPNHRFEEHPIYRAIERHFVDGADWKSTELYQDYDARIRYGDPYWRCRTEDELEAYFASIDELYEHIRRHGYKSQRQLLQEDSTATRRHATDAIHPALHEVSVHIYRDGTLAKARSGFHRLSIALILGLESIPLTVRVRHAEWQAIRDEVRVASTEQDLSEKARAYKEHPDLADIWPG